ncbi:Anaerobic dimethyl sulfoxide reductase chain B, iron-sulfur binding subunit [hydrothermal vent metagenome]|uniref:Anaerobic dimethyl sulfoxide reductase chain B, iron-sulfur binding subunit n=1 Tax=hydrothermal vent metagenome TaxID=652676 RepID=A0A3B1AIS5_9ZZZZ
MFKVRSEEPDYAFVPKVKSPELNRYGKKIQLVDKNDELAGKSLNINGDSGISDNPDRYKQHGFYFNADNCISCHACESACSEKNDLPPHLAFRAVGYLEGGTYPSYTRLNISMACNHCDDPVCLKGCPTRAYTKFAEYGAVLQDPDICFGCGYCTWVCPYNAPQLDSNKGHVQKCNMCVDRLEVGLKPACVSACLATALDFGVIETTPENRDQLDVKIPGFPSPDITNPNIRFQQTKSLPREMTRPDSAPLRYEKDEQGNGEYKTKVHDTGVQSQWNFSKLSSRENPLVIFTLLTQTVVGAFLFMFLAPMFGLKILLSASQPILYSTILFSLLGLETFALALSTMHLGKPHRFYRAFNNLRYSPVSREVAAIAVFYNLLALYTVLSSLPVLLSWLPENIATMLISGLAWAAVVSGPLALYFMHKIYRIKARPYWNHWQVLTSFYGNMFSLGALVVALIYGVLLMSSDTSLVPLFAAAGSIAFIGILMEAIGLFGHAKALKKTGGEAAASHYEQTTTFGKTYKLRNVGILLSLLLIATLLLSEADGAVAYFSWLFVALLIVTNSIISRAMFYVLVIATTMPGAFFWRNKGFQEHARDTGLAEMEQVGVLPEYH